MRILTGTEVLAPVGGIEVCVHEDATALSDRGHSIELLYTRDGVQRADLEQHGVVLRGPEQFSFEPRHAARDLATFVRSGRRVRRLGCDVLWLHRAEKAIWAQVVARIARVPLVVHLHHDLNHPMLKHSLVGVTRYIAVSQYMKDVWSAVGVPAERIEVVPNAIPAEKYPRPSPDERSAARARLGVGEGVRVVLILGRVTQDKGVLNAVRAWKALGADPTRAVLVIVGDGAVDGTITLPGSQIQDDAAIAAAVAELPPGAVIRLPGTDDVVPLLHAADLLVAPSLHPESFGRVVVEGMLAGVPSIGSDLGGTAEILSGHLARFAVPPGDVDALAERLGELLDWRDEEPTLADLARDDIVRRYSHAEHVDEVARVLQEAVADGSARARRPWSPPRRRPAGHP